MNWILTGLLGLLLIIIFYWAYERTNYWSKRGIQFLPNALPFIGNSLDILFLRKSFVQVANDVYNKFKNEKFAGYFQFTTPIMVVCDPELINTIMIKEFSSFHDRGMPIDNELEPLLANIANLVGEPWRILRHKLTPTFTSGKLKMMVSQIADCSDNSVEFIKRKKGEPIEAKLFMQQFNLMVIGLIAFGLKVDAFSDDEKDKQFLQISTRFFAPSFKTLIKFFLRMSLPKLSLLLKLRLIDDEVNTFFKNLVKDTVEYREKTQTRRNDFLQLMLDLRDKEKEMLHNKQSFYSGLEKPNVTKNENIEDEDQELMDQLKNVPSIENNSSPVFTQSCIEAQTFLFISAGSETTANALSFAIYELAANQDIQEKLQNEIDDIMSSRNFDYYAVKDMKYLEQFLFEVMRVYPPGGVLARVCTDTFIIPGTDKIIEKGIMLHIPVSAIHKDPKYFPDPEKFNPDRFEDMHSIPKGAYLPFGAGPRICIAMRLAMLEMKIIIAKLVYSFHVKVNEKTQLPLKMAKNAIAQTVVGGMWVNFEERR